ncbi:hypothetical protein BMS3Abin12_00002 [bacterium BMS3Abin12]|nr:hypothetical protein BMS3Abin12_00002 [bacterium BMS3Abin12]
MRWDLDVPSRILNAATLRAFHTNLLDQNTSSGKITACRPRFFSRRRMRYLLATPLLNRIRLNSQNNGKPPSAGSDATPERAADP